MRDPKTHAKVLALRWETLWRGVREEDDQPRKERLIKLRSRATGAMGDHQDRTGWIYAPWHKPPQWQYTETIPDTEETS